MQVLILLINGSMDDPSYYISEKAALDGQAGYLIDFRFKGELVKTITTVMDAQFIYPADIPSILGVNNYIELENIGNIKAENLRSDVKVLDVTGTFTKENTRPIKAEYILSSYVGFVNGEKIVGKMSISTPTMENNTVVVPSGFVTENITFTAEAPVSGSMDFYECDQVNVAPSGIVITGTDSWDGWYVLLGHGETGANRVF